MAALCANAALLLCILTAMLSRSNLPSISAAFAAEPAPQPIAGGDGIYLMPAQFGPSKWGCLVMDTHAQTLCAYEFYSGDKQLRLVAARSIRYDRRLEDFSTLPSPGEVQQWTTPAGAPGKTVPAQPAPTSAPQQGPP